MGCGAGRTNKNAGIAVAEVSLFDYDAERALLGAMMLSREGVLAGAVLGADDFHKVEHGTIFQAILAVHEGGAFVDPVTVCAQLNGSLGKVGGPSFIASLPAETPASANAAAYAAIVGELARTRRAQATLATMHERIMCGGDWTVDISDLVGLQSDTSASDRLMSGAAFVAAQPEGHPTVWGDGEEVLWAAGQSLFVVGPPGVGKSTLTTQLVAGRLGLQEQVLGYDVEMTGSRVLYLACDRPTQIAGLFKRLFGPEDMEALEESLVVWRGPLEQDVAQHPELLTRMCQASGCDTLVIDSLKDVTTELSTDEAGGGINRALQMALAEEIEVLVCHHQKKGQGGAKPKTLEDVHGNSAFRNGAGSVVLLWGAAGDPVVELSHLKQPVAPVGPLSIIHDHASGRSRVDSGPTDALVVMRGRAGGLTAHDLAAQDCGGDPSKNETQKARNRLERLVKKNLARMVPGTKDEADRYVAVLPD